MSNLGPTVYGANSITRAVTTNIPGGYNKLFYIWHVNDDIFSFRIDRAYNETNFIHQWDNDDIGINKVHVCLFVEPFILIKCNSTMVFVSG